MMDIHLQITANYRVFCWRTVSFVDDHPKNFNAKILFRYVDTVVLYALSWLISCICLLFQIIFLQVLDQDTSIQIDGH